MTDVGAAAIVHFGSLLRTSGGLADHHEPLTNAHLHSLDVELG